MHLTDSGDGQLNPHRRILGESRVALMQTAHQKLRSLRALDKSDVLARGAQTGTRVYHRHLFGSGRHLISADREFRRLVTCGR